MNRIRIFIADDHDIVLRGIKAVIDSVEDMMVVGTATDGRDLSKRIRGVRPDVVLLDLRMPDFSIKETMKALRESRTPPRVIVVSAHLDHNVVNQHLGEGVDGYLLKEDALSSTLIIAIRAVLSNTLYTSPHVTMHLHASRTASDMELNEHQIDVLRLLLQGDEIIEIAQKHDVSKDAIYTALSRMRAKLGLRNNRELILYGMKLGLGD